MSTSENHPPPGHTSVIDRDSVRGWIEQAGRSDEATSHVFVRTEDGRVFSVPRDLLVDLKQGGYALSASFADLSDTQLPAVSDAAIMHPNGAPTSDRGGSAVPREKLLVVPVLAEKLVVSKRPVVVGRMRITKRVRSHEESVDETVQVERADVERVPIDRIVDTAPGIRYEGDTMVISVVEEVIVVEKRLMLREELRISKRQLEQRINEKVTLRSEELTVERFDSEGRQREGDRE